jgi:hypothetical protein
MIGVTLGVFHLYRARHWFSRRAVSPEKRNAHEVTGNRENEGSRRFKPSSLRQTDADLGALATSQPMSSRLLVERA